MNSYNMVCFITLMALMISASTVTAQTFQYSRGWTNGKRAGMASVYEMSLLDRLLTNPCQLEKLRYVLQGKPLNEKLLVPCDLVENEIEATPLRLRRSAPEYEQRNQNNRPDFV